MNCGDPPVCAVYDEALTAENVLLSCIAGFRGAVSFLQASAKVLGDEETSEERLFLCLRRCNLIERI